MNFKKYTVVGLALFIMMLVIAISSCRKDQNFITDSTAMISFSKDTLRFDTVFTTQGSATRLIKVFNKNDQPIKLSKVYLEKSTNSLFNLNVDGIPGKLVKDVEIEAKDSIYIFVEVKINPDNPESISPFIVEENLFVELNGVTRTIVLQAFGQNANYIPNNMNSNGVAITTCQLGNISWDDPKPYVIFGVLLIDSCTLNIPAGARVYVHGGVSKNSFGKYSDGIIYFLGNGRLNVQGTKDNPVIIQGDRLEKEYADVPGQWAGIRFATGSVNNNIRYAEIKNAIVGIRADSSSQVRVYNSKIYNTSSSGVLAEHCIFVAENCLFYNNGGNAVQSEFGGSLFLRYCTLASFGNDQPALQLSNLRCLDATCINFLINPLSADIQNCIITGSQSDELRLIDQSGQAADFKLNLKNNIVKVKNLLNNNVYPDFLNTMCISCINAMPNDHLFKDLSKQNFELDTLSIAENKATPLNLIPKDIRDELRDVMTPDIGCYEYIYH